MTNPLNPESPPPARLRVRDDLHFSYQSYGNQPCYLLEDPLNAQYFRIGITEYALFQLLDGTQDLEEIVPLLNTDIDNPVLEMDEATKIMQWLVQNQLAHVQHPEHGTWGLAPVRSDALQTATKRLNLLFLRIPFGSPDKLITAALPWFKWMLGWRFFWVWLLIVGSGLYQMAVQSERFATAANSFLSVNNALWLVLAWVFVKTIHELFHGLVCKKYGGHIHEAGLFLILFAPLGGYVNANAMWRFTSRWQRMHVSSAGMFIELLIAGVAAWIWAYTDVGAINYLAYNSIIIAGVGTLLFNINPLMRFDGYYILADGLDVPSLYTSGQRYTRYLARRYLQGRDEPQPTFVERQSRLIKLYGIAAWFWRLFLMVTILAIASLLLEGAGILFAALGLFIWLGVPFVRFLLGLRKDPHAGKVIFNTILRLGLFISLVTTLLYSIHWSQAVSVPAIADYKDAQVIHVDSAGFVQSLNVQPSQTVKAGQLLLQLRNRDLETDLTDVAKQIKIHQLKQQQALTQKQLAVSQVEQEKIDELKTEQHKLSAQVEALSIRTPIAGDVIAAELDSLQGLYLRQGQAILTIGQATQLELHASIEQESIDFFRTKVGQTVTVYSDGKPNQPITATLLRVNPAANHYIRDPALSALGGGNLAVRPKQTQSEEQDSYEYLQARFAATISLSIADSSKIHAGETAQIVLDAPSLRLWDVMYRYLTRYFRVLLKESAALL